MKLKVWAEKTLIIINMFIVIMLCSVNDFNFGGLIFLLGLIAILIGNVQILKKYGRSQIM